MALIPQFDDLWEICTKFGNKNSVGREKIPIIFPEESTVGKKSIRALEIFRVQKLILNATS